MFRFKIADVLCCKHMEVQEKLWHRHLIRVRADSMFQERSGSDTVPARQEKVQSITIVGSNSELFLLPPNRK